LTIAFSVLLRAFGVWLLILMLAIANGLLREEVLRPHLDAPYAQLLSGVLLIACILLVTYVFAGRLAASSTKQFTAIGISWLLLTLAFEFAFGKLVAGKSWTELLDAYTFAGGNLWPVVLAVTLLAPPLIGRHVLRKRKQKA